MLKDHLTGNLMIDIFKQLPQWLKAIIIFPLVFLNGWLIFTLINYLEPLGSIFVTATLIAFLLDFPIRLLDQRGVPRILAIAIVFLLAVVIAFILALILIPLLLEQLSDLIGVLPKWIESGIQQIQHLETLRQWAIAQNLSIDLSSVIAQITEKVSAVIQSLSNQALSFLLGTIGSILNIVFVLVLSIFLVFTGNSVWDGIFSWLPSPFDVKLRELILEKFEQYFASQAILAGILSVAQTIVFLVLQVPYGVLFGVAIGVTTLIPYASALTIILVSFILALQDIGLGIQVLLAALIVGQVNDNVVAPRLMGNLTGLNPVWLIISLFIGGKIAGILGLLLAVPIASVIKSSADIFRSGGFTEE
jgi:predicted PurR-regulated permease PerM